MPDQPSDRTPRLIGLPGLRARPRPPYVLAGVAVAALLGGAGAALAAGKTGAPARSAAAIAATPSPAPAQPAAPGHAVPGWRRWGASAGPAGGLLGVLHGQFVVAKPGGGYQTVDMQNGKVTAVSKASITLKSADGFTKSYAVTSSTLVDAQRDGISSVKAGNQAVVVATVSGGTDTVTSIRDLTLLRNGFPVPGRGWAAAGAPGPQPAGAPGPQAAGAPAPLPG